MILSKNFNITWSLQAHCMWVLRNPSIVGIPADNFIGGLAALQD
jgi:hypothetical protein